MRAGFAAELRCSTCGGQLTAESCWRPSLSPSGQTGSTTLRDGVLQCSCGSAWPVVAGVPRILPSDALETLVAAQPSFFQRFPELRPATTARAGLISARTQRAFGDEWRRFPELHQIHRRIFEWYFEGPEPVRWKCAGSA